MLITLEENPAPSSVFERICLVCCCVEVNKPHSLTPGHPHKMTLPLAANPPESQSIGNSVFQSLLRVWDMSQGNTTSKPRVAINMFILLLPVPIQQITMALLFEYFWKKA